MKEEKDLADSIRVLAEVGFSQTDSNVKDLVEENISRYGIQNEFRDNWPGCNWLKAFYKLNQFSSKQVNLISIARKSATDFVLFVLYDFYEKLERVVKELNLSPGQIWNCDESGFPSDPRKIKAVSG